MLSASCILNSNRLQQSLISLLQLFLMNTRQTIAFISLISVAAALVLNQRAETIYTNGSILTMAGWEPQYVEAVAVAGSKIIFAGSQNTAREKHSSPNTTFVNLEGKTMIPGFIDAHSHLSLSSLCYLFADLYPPPLGNTSNFDDIVANTRQWAEKNTEFVKEVGWIIGFSYDDSILKEKKHPTKEVLDRISTELPVLLIYQSMHVGALNSKALELLGIDKNYVNPPGGQARRVQGSTEPNGVLQEKAFFANILSVFKKFSPKRLFAAFVAGQRVFARTGFTTVTDGKTDQKSLAMLTQLAEKGQLYLDVASYVDYKSVIQSGVIEKYSKWISLSQYTNRYRIAGGKLMLDGSVQAFTGWMSQRYKETPPNMPEDYSGYPAFKNTSQVVKAVTAMRQKKLQIIAHANGDKSIDQLIEAVSQSRGTPYAIPKIFKHPFNFTNLDGERVVCIHCQVTRPEQIQQLKKNYIIPSFFGAHIYFWGDWHHEHTIGQRAAALSRAGSAVKQNMLFTSHLDTPVVRPNLFYAIASAVNRKTRSGLVLGSDQKITPYQALLSVTRFVAYQMFEEGKKGSIQIGKLADFAVLSDNPLTINSQNIAMIKVLKTIKENKVIYDASVDV